MTRPIIASWMTLLLGAPLVLPCSAATAEEPALPPNAHCTGRWTGRLSLTRKTCDDARLAPYRDFDVTVRAGPSGFEASVARPAGFRVDAVRVDWSAPG